MSFIAQGKAAFGASTARDLRFKSFPDASGKSVQDEVTPGPAAYRPLSHRIMSRASSSFKSLMPQRLQWSLPSAENPGPGTYDPNFDSINPVIMDMVPDIKNGSGREGRFTGDSIIKDSTTGPVVGPGTYESHLEKTITQGLRPCALCLPFRICDINSADFFLLRPSGSLQTVDRNERYLSGNVRSQPYAFSTTSPQRQLPHMLLNQTEFREGLGPGAYNPFDRKECASITTSSYNQQNLEGKGGFGSKSEQHDIKVYDNGTGDPGKYDPNEGNPNREIASQAKKSFRTANIEGKGSFNAELPRVLPLHGAPHIGEPHIGFKPEKTPGPAAYDLSKQIGVGDMTNLEGAELMKSSSFASESPQRGKWSLPQAENPGPGTYDPNWDSIYPLPMKYPVPFSARDTRFPGDSIIRDSQTGPHIGPGTYEPEVTNDGQRNSIEVRAEHNAWLGETASFVSERIRTMWLGWFGDNDELNTA